MEINKHIIFYPLDSKFIKRCTVSAIKDACKKRQLSAYGFLWEYKKDEDKKKVRKERRGKWKSIVR